MVPQGHHYHFPFFFFLQKSIYTVITAQENYVLNVTSCFPPLSKKVTLKPLEVNRMFVWSKDGKDVMLIKVCQNPYIAHIYIYIYRSKLWYIKCSCRF